MKRWLAGFALLLITLVGGGFTYLWWADQYQHDGSMTLRALSAPVRVVRDEQGVPYIFAASLDDAIRAQGFIAGQDRLFQIEFERYLSHGRLSELIGEAGLKSDIPLRVIGIPRLAKRHAQILGGEERRLRELYLEGLNAYILEHRDEHPVALRLLGIKAEPWTLEDTVALSYFINWSTSANLATELVSQMIIDRVGPAKAAEISQLTVNPDLPEQPPVAAVSNGERLNLRADSMWLDAGPQPFRVGSNNWVVSGARTAHGAPIVVNDPHVDARTLPGIWYPTGLITPELRAVGMGGAGLPGFAVARTDRIAFGITNAYGDVADLFIEREDPAQPGHYLEGDQSLPFEVIEDVLHVRDRAASSGFREMPLKIRFTRRGPVISDHGMGVEDGKLISLRWSVSEAMRPDDSGGTTLFLARSVAEARTAVGRINAPYNYVVADVDGNIAHFAAGRVPIRRRGDGAVPLVVADQQDSWAGMIPSEQMPGTVNPARGWVGTANHRTLPADYPYPYSTYFAASWRYRRIVELLDPPGRHSAQDHWHFLWDTKNLMAAAAVPTMATALAAHEDTRDLAALLRSWNLRDDPDQVAPTIFQSVFRHFARLTFEDELGPELAERMLDSPYYWQERLLRLMQSNSNPWFDDVTTSAVETRDDLLHNAALAARQELTGLLGAGIDNWTWGRVHTVTFFSPTIPGRLAAAVLGGGTHPKDGSGETLNRGSYRFGAPYGAIYIPSMRFVADLADSEKVMALVAGGASGRQFDAHLKDQLGPWFAGEPRYLWFSDPAIAAHRRHELHLNPR